MQDAPRRGRSLPAPVARPGTPARVPSASAAGEQRHLPVPARAPCGSCRPTPLPSAVLDPACGLCSDKINKIIIIVIKIKVVVKKILKVGRDT